MTMLEDLFYGNIKPNAREIKEAKHAHNHVKLAFKKTDLVISLSITLCEEKEENFDNPHSKLHSISLSLT